ncbi:unnamed protein product, partial [Musa acuminata subsp. burmannicoides]
RKEHVNETASVGYEAAMFVSTCHQLYRKPRANPRRPQHKNCCHREDHNPIMGHKKRHCREHHHRQHAVPNQARAPVQIQVPVPSGEHIEDHIEVESGDDEPTQDDPKVELSGEKLEETEDHEEEERAGEVGVLVDTRVHAEG